jgi:hypothetical protein
VEFFDAKNVVFLVPKIVALVEFYDFEKFHIIHSLASKKLCIIGYF